tara:strand:- start:543 stop:788 length:246 start_codon:yes stop_codon:yes gene_type:complete
MKLSATRFLLAGGGEAEMAQSAFQHIRIGGIEGIGFRDTTDTYKPFRAVGRSPADAADNQQLDRDEGSLFFGGHIAARTPR